MQGRPITRERYEKALDESEAEFVRIFRNKVHFDQGESAGKFQELSHGIIEVIWLLIEKNYEGMFAPEDIKSHALRIATIAIEDMTREGVREILSVFDRETISDEFLELAAVLQLEVNEIRRKDTKMKG